MKTMFAIKFNPKQAVTDELITNEIDLITKYQDQADMAFAELVANTDDSKLRHIRSVYSFYCN